MNIFAHRGLSEKYPENSLAAFRAAIEQGVEGIELDIIMTKDEEFVVSHDIFIKNSEGKTKDLRQLTVSEISVLDLPEKFGGEKIPALSQVLSIIPEKMMLNIELKIEYGEDYKRLCRRFLEFMNQVPVEHKTILISSFYLPPIRFIQKNSSLKTAFILNNSMTSFFIKIYLLLTGWGADYLHIRSDMSVKFWKKFKRFKGIQVYTVNTIEEAEKLKLLGADGIFTDRADEMMNLTTLMTDV